MCLSGFMMMLSMTTTISPKTLSRKHRSFQIDPNARFNCGG